MVPIKVYAAFEVMADSEAEAEEMVLDALGNAGVETINNIELNYVEADSEPVPELELIDVDLLDDDEEGTQIAVTNFRIQ